MVSNWIGYQDKSLSYQINQLLPAFRYFLAVGSAPGEGREETSQILFPSIWSSQSWSLWPQPGAMPAQTQLERYRTLRA